jgi:hypothetical protein
MAPPFPASPNKPEYELEANELVEILPWVETNIFPPFPAFPKDECENEVRSPVEMLSLEVREISPPFPPAPKFE